MGLLLKVHLVVYFRPHHPIPSDQLEDAPTPASATFQGWQDRFLTRLNKQRKIITKLIIVNKTSEIPQIPGLRNLYKSKQIKVQTTYMSQMKKNFNHKTFYIRQYFPWLFSDKLIKRTTHNDNAVQ